LSEPAGPVSSGPVGFVLFRAGRERGSFEPAKRRLPSVPPETAKKDRRILDNVFRVFRVIRSEKDKNYKTREKRERRENPGKSWMSNLAGSAYLTVKGRFLPVFLLDTPGRTGPS
jgi:hypothetical protein